MRDHLQNLGAGARWGLALGIAAILLAAAAAAFWLVRTDYHVLFADLKPQDAAAMVAELDRQKIPYRLAEGGSTILVDARQVHATRLKLMGKDMPLAGAAGFELFNNGDFGMTEFAQKINYQRALQGEITRTILSLEEIRDARVHLALPEEGLFKRTSSKPKASITLRLKPGHALRADQVSGIQRLVVGAVPGIAAQDVTIVDQQGVALTRLAGSEPDQDTGSARLDLKRETEKLLLRKATEVLERAFGAGQAMASVDVTLNMDQVKVTTEDVVGAPAHAGQAPAGVIVRQRETLREAGTQGASVEPLRNGSSQRELEYQVGRRIEHVVVQPGAIRRLHVAAVVRQPLDAQQLEQVRALLSAAVGSLAERGDSVVIQSLHAFNGATHDAAEPLAAPALEGATGAHRASESALPQLPPWPLLAVLLLIGSAGTGWWWASRRRESAAALTTEQRESLAARLDAWLADAQDAKGARP